MPSQETLMPTRKWRHDTFLLITTTNDRNGVTPGGVQTALSTEQSSAQYNLCKRVLMIHASGASERRQRPVHLASGHPEAYP
jgi:hypothetical protein